MGDAGYDGGPDGDEDEGYDHARCDAASDVEEVGQFSVVVFVVERFGGHFTHGLAAGKGAGTLVGGWGGLRGGAGVGGHGDGR